VVAAASEPKPRLRVARVLAAGALGALATAAVAAVSARALTPAVSKPSVCPDDPSIGNLELFLRCGKKMYSQGDEELLIRHFFRDRRAGVFLDVGSGHYKTGSTTYYLERHLGWNGIAVDAQPDYGPEYVTYRPATRFFSYLVTDHSGTTEPFYKLKVMFQMSSASKEWAENAEDGAAEEVVQRPTITLNELLTKAGVSKVDFLSMDIESGEPAALAGFDIDKYRPDLVCVEMADRVRERIAGYFAAHAYERIAAYEVYDRVNGYFKPR
jgi:FkbM family methyltransferase